MTGQRDWSSIALSYAQWLPFQHLPFADVLLGPGRPLTQYMGCFIGNASKPHKEHWENMNSDVRWITLMIVISSREVAPMKTQRAGWTCFFPRCPSVGTPGPTCMVTLGARGGHIEILSGLQEVPVAFPLFDDHCKPRGYQRTDYGVGPSWKRALKGCAGKCVSAWLR